jgi:hypothetical protein
MKSIKYCLKRGEKGDKLKEYNKEGELVIIALYTSIKLSQ